MRCSLLLLFVLLTPIYSCFSQESDSLSIEVDSVAILATEVADLIKENSSVADTNKFKKFVRNFSGTIGQTFAVKPFTELERPKVAFVRSLILPGWGQATNKDYWKIPLVYVAAGAGYYFGIRSNQTRYLAYRQVRVNLYAMSIGNVSLNGDSFSSDNIYFEVDPSSTSFDIRDAKVVVQGSDEAFYSFSQTSNLDEKKIPDDTTFELVPVTSSDEDNIRGPFQNSRIESGMNQFRRYRDLSRIGFAVGWLLFALEANVAGHMNTFDISDDISMKVQPMPLFTQQSVGMGINMRLSF